MDTPVEKRETPETRTHVLSEAECHRVLAVVRACACRNGVHRQDVEDMAMGFLVRILAYVKCHPEKDPAVVFSHAWLARAATNWIKNGLRANWRRQHRELALPTDSEEENEGDATPSRELISNEPSPYLHTVREDFHQRLRDSIADANLTPAQLALLKPLMNGESAADIARRTGRQPDAVRQLFHSIRKRLHASLLAHDLGYAEIAAYLSKF